MRMESDEFDFLAPAYVKGFLRAYARFLNLPADQILEDFEARFGPGRVDAAHMVALEGRRVARNAPRLRPRLSSWGAAAVLALVVAGGLALIGLVTGPDDDGRASDGAPGGFPGAQTTVEPSATVTPSASPTTPDAIKGLSVEIVAVRDPCWVEITADGVNETPGGILLEVGDRAGPFAAEESITILFGFASGVDLIVNGENLGMPADTDVFELSLPEDLDKLRA